MLLIGWETNVRYSRFRSTSFILFFLLSPPPLSPGTKMPHLCEHNIYLRSGWWRLSTLSKCDKTEVYSSVFLSIYLPIHLALSLTPPTHYQSTYLSPSSLYRSIYRAALKNVVRSVIQDHLYLPIAAHWRENEKMPCLDPSREYSSSRMCSYRFDQIALRRYALSEI